MVLLHTGVIEVGAVERSHIGDSIALWRRTDLGMAPGDADVVQNDRRVGASTDRHHRQTEAEQGSGAGTAHEKQGRLTGEETELMAQLVGAPNQAQLG